MKESKLKNTLHDCLRNRNLMIGLVILLSIIVIAIFADSIAPFPYNKNSVGGRLEAPSAAHWFGTDEMGRDMFSRVIGGTRITLWICFLGAALQLVIGVAVGLISGYFGKWVDRVFSFMTDLTWCIPGTILALTARKLYFGKGLTNFDHRDLTRQLGILCTSGSCKDDGASEHGFRGDGNFLR